MSDAFSDKLVEGERIVWSGRPVQGLWLTMQDVLLIPFSLLWGGFALFWEHGVLAQDGRAFFLQLWGVPFVLVGMFLMFGRFILDAYLRAHLFYAITDRRALIVRTGLGPAFTWVGLDLPALEMVAAGAGRASVYLAPRTDSGRNMRPVWVPALHPRPAFIAIAEADRVMALLSTTPREGINRTVVTSQGLPATWLRMVPFGLLIPFVLFGWLGGRSGGSCKNYGGADVQVVRAFATTEASYDNGLRAPATRFGADDTAMALVILNWPDKTRSAGQHLIEWNWFRDRQIVFHTRFCSMRFTDSPFTLRTWRSARELGAGHFHVDTLIDGTVVAASAFEIQAVAASTNMARPDGM